MKKNILDGPWNINPMKKEEFYKVNESEFIEEKLKQESKRIYNKPISKIKEIDLPITKTSQNIYTYPIQDDYNKIFDNIDTPIKENIQTDPYLDILKDLL